MKKGNGYSVEKQRRVFSDFLFSDLELGILKTEIYNDEEEGFPELIKFNRLEMILELNDKIIAN